MNESTQHDLTSIELPRLRIHHFFVLTTVFAVVMSVWLGLWRLVSSSHPDVVMPEFSTGISLLVIVQWFSQSACIAVTLLGLAWRKRGLSFPNQPGHWMAVYLAVAGAYELVLSLIFLFPDQVIEFESTALVTMPMSLLFHCFAFALWVAAYLHEPARIWKLSWAAMALKSLLFVLLMLFIIGAKCLQWLLETYWYNAQFDWQLLMWQLSMPLGSYTTLTSYGLLSCLQPRYSTFGSIDDCTGHTGW
ncbi:MAG: hypothetical protein GXP24_03160 [Planctomycetes bacterium]|nr:hypothetical protein [Planctomycetota bacterium]